MAIVVTYKLTGIEALTRMQCINAVKRALRSVGEYWHDAFAWKRFTEAGYSEYGFRWRSRKYDDAKLRHHQHRNPLVATGEGKAETLSESTKQRIRVTRDTVRIPMPRKFNRYNPKGPNMSEEIRAVSRAEVRVLEENLVLNIDSELAREEQLTTGASGAARVKSLRLHGIRGGQRIVNPIARRAA